MQIKIGIECHVQLKTKSKLFCSCSVESEKPNSSVCDVCLGMPGSKPVLNKMAVELALRVATILNCKINKKTLFSRKSYFYPDMTKNYQITQFELPLAEKGHLDGINITRIQLEEDPGSLIHQKSYTLVDYNRAGIPLIEIVTEPDFDSAEEVRALLNKLITTLEYLDVYSRKSAASLRVDANVSINKGERVEIKNIYGIKDVERALNYEVKRQQKEKAIRETRGWNSLTKSTIPLRRKETEADYGYILEPDLPPLIVDDGLLKSIKENLPELAEEKASRFIKQYKIDPTDSKIITQDYLVGNLFEEVVSKGADPTLASRWFRRELLRVLNYKNKCLSETPINATHLVKLFSLLKTSKITDTTAQRILEILVQKNIDIEDYIKKQKLGRVSDTKTLELICQKVIKNNSKAVQDYKAGKMESLHFLTGQIMKETKGQADPSVVKDILNKLIKNTN